MRCFCPQKALRSVVYSSVCLEGLCGKTAPAALPLADHLLALLAGGDAVSVAFEDFLGNPSDDGRRVLCALELADKLLLELFNVGH